MHLTASIVLGVPPPLPPPPLPPRRNPVPYGPPRGGESQSVEQQKTRTSVRSMRRRTSTHERYRCIVKAAHNAARALGGGEHNVSDVIEDWKGGGRRREEEGGDREEEQRWRKYGGMW
jgi:hypothetical protein